jgi:hypothetical protein
VNEYLNKFTQLSRYSPDDANTDKKKQDAFMNGLNDEIQFQLLNTDYADFQRMVDMAITVENKLKEMERHGKWKMSFQGNPQEATEGPAYLSLTPSSEHHKWFAHRCRDNVLRFQCSDPASRCSDRVFRCNTLSSKHLGLICSSIIIRSFHSNLIQQLSPCKTPQLKEIRVLVNVSSAACWATLPRKCPNK